MDIDLSAMEGPDAQPAIVREHRIYDYDDFCYTNEPFEEVYSCRRDKLLHDRTFERIARQATDARYFGFKKLYREWQKQKLAQEHGAGHMVYARSLTEFQGQPMELDAGDWQATDSGITRYGGDGEVMACIHPIMPVERLTNIDTGTEKLKLAFRKGGPDSKWRELIVEKSVLASPQKILALADQGVAVTSETAKSLITYLSDVENLNYEIIPRLKAITRLGHIEGEGFSPYVDGLVFDGDLKYRHIFGAVCAHGTPDGWLEMAGQVRRGTITARIVLAAAFASVLVEPLGALPFFVHLWGGESGTGKTVALMVAASVWGNPERGQYVQTFNSTDVGYEMMAAFLNHLPLIVDELQLAKDSRGVQRFNVYKLAEGVGRTRSNKNLGLNKTPTWSNCILTTGESPLVNDNAGAGAVNRVIEVECNEVVIADGPGTAAATRAHYGHAGRAFVERLYREDDPQLEAAKAIYDGYYAELSRGDTTEKQAMAAAVVLTADKLATDWIFKDGLALQAGELAQFLASKTAVSIGERAYAYMQDWVTINHAKLGRDATGDVYGVLEDVDGVEQVAYIVASVFRRALEDEGYSSKAVLSHFKKRGIIKTRGRRMTLGKRIKGVNTECVAMRMGILEDGSIGMADDDWPVQSELKG